MDKSNSVIDKTINYVFNGLVVILPLFFLPFNLISNDMDAFGKSFLLLVASLSLIALLFYKKQKNNDNKFRLSYFFYLFLFFIFSLLVSAISGVDPRTSFWGSGGMTLSVINYASFFLIYFFTINYVKNEKRFKSAVSSFVVSYFISVWLVFLAFLLKWLSLIKPSSEIFSVINSQNGAFEDFSIYLALMSFFILTIFLQKKQILFSHLWFVKISWVLGIFLLVQINFITAWVLLVISLVLFSYNIFKQKDSYKLGYAKRLIGLLFLLSSAMLVMNFTITGQSAVFKSRQADNFHLDQKNSRIVALKSLRSDPFFGQGGENFKIAFSKYRSQEMNNLSWWDKRFKKSFSYICDIAVATGIFGTLIFLGMLVFVIFYYIKFSQLLFSKKNESELSFFHNAFLFLVLIVVTFFLYNTNINILFLFIIFLALINHIVKEHSISVPQFFKKFPDHFFYKNDSHKLSLIALGIFFVMSILVLLNMTKAVFAQMNFENSQKTVDQNEREKILVKANNLNPRQVEYKLALSRFYKNRIDEILSKGDNLNLNSFEDEMNLAINSAKTAISLSPNSVTAYEIMGVIYRDIGKYSSDSNTLAITAFEKANEIEPTNPVMLFELAKLYYNSGRIDEAISNTRESLALKNDLEEVRFFLARLLIESGDYDEALKELESMEGGLNDINVKYEIGRAHFNQKNYMKAKEKFAEVIKFDATNSNALYSLALSLEKLNRREEALLYYKKVLSLNPDNAEIRKKVLEF